MTFSQSQSSYSQHPSAPYLRITETLFPTFQLPFPDPIPDVQSYSQRSIDTVPILFVPMFKCPFPDRIPIVRVTPSHPIP